MEINRVWEMPNSRTFQIKSIKEIIEKYSYGVVIDPFANSNKLATITNDLDERYETDYHMDATDFLLMFENESVEWRFCWSHTADGTMTQLLLSKKKEA